MQANSIEREIRIDASPERVWTVLTEPEHLAEWFAFAGADIDLRPGGELRFRWAEHGEFFGVIERVERPHRLSFRWARPASEAPRAGNSTLVEFTLEPDGAGTQLRVVESGFDELPAAERQQAIRDNTEGWAGAFSGLADYVNRIAA